MARPRLILLDEPSLGLSPAAQRSWNFALLDELRHEGTAMLIVEQDLALLSTVAGRAYQLRYGALEAMAAIRLTTYETRET